ncbi:MAG: V-type ATP synthase subunit I [Oscillospiraceae bacterium]|jgi:V/A-type H+-transporting ATPase subunit I|nr:V-type ATP synthase subunit I [Oscillospiraceae bacterium]
MIADMSRFRLVGLASQRKAILETLQRTGSVEVSPAAGDASLYTPLATSDTCALLEKIIKASEDASEVLDRVAPDKSAKAGMFAGRAVVSANDFDSFYQRSNLVYRTALDIISDDKAIAAAQNEISKLEARRLALAPWLSLPVPLNFAGTENTRVFVGSFEGQRSREQIMEAAAAAAPELSLYDMEIVAARKEQTCVLAVVHRDEARAFEQALTSVGFIKPAAETQLNPQAEDANLVRQIETHKKNEAAAAARIGEASKKRADILFLADHCRMRLAKYEAMRNVAQGEYTVLLEGWVEKSKARKLADKLEKSYDCVIELTEPEDGDDVPIKLVNNKFAGAIESVLTGFGLPQRGEADPLNVMALFYYALFGLMFSDAGYGIILTGACFYILKKYKNLEDGMKNSMRMFMGCGIATTFWGFVFGSFFGNVVGRVSDIFGSGTVALKPLWYDPVAEPMRLLMFSFVIGIAHLSAAYIMKAVSYVRAGKAKEILFDVIFPLFTFYALLGMLVGTSMFATMAGSAIPVPAWLNTICMGVAAACAIGIILFGGRESRSWVKRILKGAYALYNVVAGWLGDVLSYARLLALGLATGVIATVMNDLAGMGGKGFAGAVMFVLIFIIGQTLNFAINVLGAYVHTNRLMYVEFFGKFYEGGGRAFAPLTIKTKNYKMVVEE